MLMIVIEEWNKDKSMLFKGYTKYTPISYEDSIIIPK